MTDHFWETYNRECRRLYIAIETGCALDTITQRLSSARNAEANWLESTRADLIACRSAGELRIASA